MEESLTKSIYNYMNLGDIDPKQMSPLVLAYIGDSVYDLAIRTYLLSKGNMPVNKINKHACALVKAQTQSELIGFMEPMFDQYELKEYGELKPRDAKNQESAENETPDIIE